MEISKLYQMQKALDARIIKEKGLEELNIFPNTVLALQVEIGEMANEWRGFKHWSNDQEPRTEVFVACKKCENTGLMGMEHDLDDCDECIGIGGHTKNPLLEEYIDCLHFFLSIAHQKGWSEHIWLSEDAVEELREEGFDGGITGAILEMQYWLAKMHMENDKDEKIEKAFGYSKKVFCFRSAFFIFIALGMVGFDFTWEQICEAYTAKNKVNHERQANGY